MLNLARRGLVNEWRSLTLLNWEGEGGNSAEMCLGKHGRECAMELDNRVSEPLTCVIVTFECFS